MDASTRDAILADVLAPISVREFCETYHEQEVLHIARKDRDRYSHLLSFHDIESMLSTQRLTLSDAQLSGGASSASGQEYLDESGHVVASRLLQGHHDGATLVLSQANRRIASLADFCRQIHAGLGMRCQTNAYLSPAGQQGFRPHYDSHDVFILQVQGCKIFHFYAGGPDLPANHHRFDPEQHKPGEHQTSIELSAGDALYIPRGIMHDAIAHADTASLHLTLGLFPLTTMDLVQELLSLGETQERDLRRSVLGTAHGAEDKALRHRLRQLLDGLASDERVDAALSALRDDLAVDAPTACHGALSSNSEATLLPETQVTAELSRWHDIEGNDQQLSLRSAGLVLTFTGTKAEIIKRLSSGQPTRIKDLGDDDEAAISLSSLLLRNGLIFRND